MMKLIINNLVNNLIVPFSFDYTLFCRKVLCQCFVNINYFVPLRPKENKVK